MPIFKKMNVLEEICFRASRKAHQTGSRSDVSHNPATFSETAYTQWRESSLAQQFITNFDPALIKGKRVLDFGCGRGNLSFLAAQSGAASVIGIDLFENSLSFARQRVVELGLSDTVTFQQATADTKVDLPDSSIDVIMCFDVMEHVMGYRKIVPEWRRVLTPNGRVLLWWSVWLHPYGHHLHTMIPLPWVHLLLSDAALFRICARIYDLPEFKPRIWHFDANGRRKPNPYAGVTEFNDLNKLTTWKAEKLFRQTGFEIARRDLKPFEGNRLAGVKRLLTKLPYPDFFCGYAIYELRRR
jgi:SAM-dependent methyltransferase